MDVVFKVTPQQLGNPKVQKALADLTDLLEKTGQNNSQLSLPNATKVSVTCSDVIEKFCRCEVKRQNKTFSCSVDELHDCPIRMRGSTQQPKYLTEVIDFSLEYIHDHKMNRNWGLEFKTKYPQTVLDTGSPDFPSMLCRIHSILNGGYIISMFKEIDDAICECEVHSNDVISSCLKDKLDGHVRCPFKQDYKFSSTKVESLFIYMLALNPRCLDSICDEKEKEYALSVYKKATHRIESIDLLSLQGAVSVSLLQSSPPVLSVNLSSKVNADHEEKINVLNAVVKYCEKLISGKIIFTYGSILYALQERYPYITDESLKWISREVSQSLTEFVLNNIGDGLNRHIKSEETIKSVNSAISLMGTGLKLMNHLSQNMPYIVDGINKVATAAVNEFSNTTFKTYTPAEEVDTNEGEKVADIVLQHVDMKTHK